MKYKCNECGNTGYFYEEVSGTWTGVRHICEDETEILDFDTNTGCGIQCGECHSDNVASEEV